MTAQGYFVAGNDTEIGKTLIASSLLRASVRAGYRTAGMKPVAAGAELRDGEWQNAVATPSLRRPISPCRSS